MMNRKFKNADTKEIQLPKGIIELARRLQIIIKCYTFTFSESSKVAHPSIVLGNNVFPLDLSTFV